MAKKKAPGRKGRGAAAPKDTGFEVESEDTGPKAGIETGLVFVTFVALVIGLILSQVELSSSFDKGWF